MSKPYVHHPACNPQPGANHRAICIRHKGQSLRIQCDTREQADQLGRALIGVFNRYLLSTKEQDGDSQGSCK